MKYISISRRDALNLRSLLIDHAPFDLAKFGVTIGEGDFFDVSVIGSLAAKGATSCKIGEDSEKVEQELSGELYLQCRAIPLEVRDDAGFWRWLTIGALQEFLKCRDPELGLEAIGAGSNTPDILACRMFLRGQVARTETDTGDLEFSLAESPGIKTHDMWQSHVLRRTTAAERPLARAILRFQSDSQTKLVTELLRPFVRDSINRKKLTRATFLMNDEEATRFIIEQRAHWSESDGDDLELDGDE
jgi:hypothetical protein